MHLASGGNKFGRAVSNLAEVIVMAMSVGSSKGISAVINVTPMIDVLLVLIIIFMVITPVTPRGLNALLPQPDEGKSTTPAASDAVVITVNGDQTVDINREQVNIRDLQGRLESIFRYHLNHVLFVKGSKTLEFQPVAQVIDIARGVGLDRVALMTK